MKPAVLFAFLAAAACGGSPETGLPSNAVVHEPCVPLVVLTPEGATALQRDAIVSARELWNGSGFTQLRGDGDGEPIALRFQPAAGFFHGLYDPDTGEVIINSTMDDAGELAIVISHELGHAMGLSHVPESERASVMNPGNVALPPTAGDNAALVRRCR